MKYTAVVIHGSAEMDRLMHALDVFEPGKVLAWPYEYTLDVAGDDPVPAVKSLVVAVRAYGHRVVAAYIPNRADWSYLDRCVTAISDGKQYTPIESILSATGYLPMDGQAVSVGESEGT